MRKLKNQPTVKKPTINYIIQKQGGPGKSDVIALAQGKGRGDKFSQYFMGGLFTSIVQE